MMLMAYLSYMLAEVRLCENFRISIYYLCMEILSFIWRTVNWCYFVSVAAIRLEWYSHSIFLRDCDVPLHLAQRNRELKNNYKVNTISSFSIICLTTTLVSNVLRPQYLLPMHLRWSRHTFATLSFLAETFIFLYVGMDALDIEKWRFVSDRYGYSVEQRTIKSLLFSFHVSLFLGCIFVLWMSGFWTARGHRLQWAQFWWV